MSKTALIIVDVQYDFLPPSGALAVPEGNQIIPRIKDLLSTGTKWRSVIATQDYHPKEHISFASNHTGSKPLDVLTVEDGWGREKELALWPDHCVIGTPGCELDKDLVSAFEPWTGKLKLARKGWDKTVENYSAFEGYLTDASNPSDPPDHIKQSTALNSELSLHLREQGVSKVVVVGVATDFCVNHTALSAIEAGFETGIYTPCIAGIDQQGSKAALDGLRDKGGIVLDDESSLNDFIE